MIPRLIHFVWLGPAEMPAWAHANMQAFRRLNPEYQVLLHGEAALASAYRAAWDRCSLPMRRSDLVRYSILEALGGWYFDLDFVPYRPLPEAERAYGLDGRRLLVCRQQGHLSGDRLPYANAPLACGPGCEAVARLREIVTRTTGGGRTELGPGAIKALVERHRSLVTVADWPFWFPAGIGRAGWLHDAGVPPQRLCPETGGQAPFAMHLWAGGQAGYPTRSGALKSLAGGRRRATVICRDEDLKRTAERPHSGVARGLQALDYSVEMRTANDRDAAIGAEVLALWNGYREPLAGIVREATAMGATVLRLEHGWWDRYHYSQCDHVGLLHRSSWADRICEPAPPEGADRLRRFLPDGLKPIRARRDGYILVLGQVPNDTQTADASVDGPLELQRIIRGAVGANTPVFFRPHPSQVVRPRNVLPVMEAPRGARETYWRTRAGLGLADAVGGARFVVAVNSNALNEALALGLPCLAFGPCLGIAAGAMRSAAPDMARDDIRAMLDGWTPEPGRVENYLRWLAARQWNAEELADPAVLGGILERAGVEVPRDA